MLGALPASLTGEGAIVLRRAWSPRRLPGLTHWFRADQGVVSSGSAVSVWRDFSGLDNHATQATGASQPTWVASSLGGKPALRFDGSLSFMSVPVNAAAGPKTYVFAFKSTRNAANRIFDHLSSTYPLFGFYFDGSRNLFMSGGTNYRYFATSTKPSDGLPHSCLLMSAGTAQGDMANSVIEIDGAALTPSAPITTGAAVASVTTMLLGGSAARFLGDLAEFVVYNRALSALERARIHSYMRFQYGVI
ncbi:hypothetical protein WMF01_12075 [Sorangium sp. So ce1667]